MPALAALAWVGVLRTPDSPGYINYAGDILHGHVPAGLALLREAPAPRSLFRMWGFPLLLAGLKLCAGRCWPWVLVLLQVAAQAGLAALAFRTARGLGASAPYAAAAALLPCLGFSVVLDLCVLTDAFYDVLLAGAALLLLRGADPRRVALAGAALGLATSFREATPYLLPFFLPLLLVERSPRLSRRLLALLAPALLVMGGQIAWNATRGAGPIMTTSRMTVMVQAVLPVLRHGLPLYDGEDPFDRAARATVALPPPHGGYGAIDALHARLFAGGMSAPEMSRIAQARFWRAWHRYPSLMARATLSNIKVGFFEMPFQPVAVAGALQVYATGRAPAFDDPGRLFKQTGASRWFWIVLDLLSDAIGIAVAAAALIGPWLLRSTPLVRRLRALWFVPVGLAGLYLPVHVEPRYLAPAVPLLWLTAVLLVSACRVARWRSSPAPRCG